MTSSGQLKLAGPKPGTVVTFQWISLSNSLCGPGHESRVTAARRPGPAARWSPGRGGPALRREAAQAEELALPRTATEDSGTTLLPPGLSELSSALCAGPGARAARRPPAGPAPGLAWGPGPITVTVAQGSEFTETDKLRATSWCQALAGGQAAAQARRRHSGLSAARTQSLQVCTSPLALCFHPLRPQRISFQARRPGPGRGGCQYGLSYCPPVPGCC